MSGPKSSQWAPYGNYGGSAVAIAGEHFSIIASDTRLRYSLTILTRSQSKIFPLTDRCAMSCMGSWNDVLAFSSLMGVHVTEYEAQHRKKPSLEALAQMCSVLLYSKRFFEFQIVTMLAGVDVDGGGVVYCLDPYGSLNRYKYMAIGSGQSMMMPFLDSQLKDIESLLCEEDCLNVIRDAFTSTTERDLLTGDGLLVNIIREGGCEEKSFPLKKD